MKPLKQVTREHLSQRQLTGKQLDHLMAMQQTAAGKPEQKPPCRQARWIPAALVATLLLLVLAGTVWLALPQANMPELIANEVVHNHLNLKPLEVRSTNIDDILRYFEKLDFTPVQSRLIADAGLQMIGGRYCSIQGIDAAQIRLRPDDGDQLQSLYQTVYDPRVFKDLPRIEQGDPPIELYVKGVKVRVWVEKGLLFAMTVEDDGPE